ncbi:MAG: BTAD domain-containing putative transcriptional regulator, partial [Chloroflexota bacterium]
MSKLQLTLLGKPQIRLNDEPLTKLTSAKAKALLFYLAVEQSTVSRELLSGLLWSDMPPESARASLRVVLSKLRGELEPFILITRREVTLQPSAEVISDLDLFLNDKDYRQANINYKGPFLDDFYLKDAPLFEEWVGRKRETYKQLLLDRLKKLAQTARQNGNLDQAISDLRTLLQFEPWREEAHRELMSLYVQNGQRTAALAQFEQCVDILKAELDIKPEQETVDLVEAIKSGNFQGQIETVVSQKQAKPLDLVKSAPNNLPTASLSFIGRQNEQQKVINHLLQPSNRLLTICGAGGMGKTRLATECARQLQPHFADGVYLVSLVATADHQLIPSVIAQALGFMPQGKHSIKNQLLNFLAQKQLLLILDNLEHLLDSIDLLLDLISHCANLKIIVTSREPLAIQEEAVLPLTGLPYQYQPTENEETSQAFDLFMTRAQRLDLSFSVESASAEIHKICALVEGMPLALELAAAWVRVIPCQEIAAEIEKNLDFLATDLNIVPSHQHSVRIVFEYSWSLLNNTEQDGLSRLAIFKGGFKRNAAEEVANVSLRTLSTLIDKSLVQKGESGRFTIHPLIRQFALEKLSEADQEA